MTLQVGVKILLKNEEGKYLMLHRSSKKYPDADGRWDCTGGRIIPGTPLMDNLRREVSEETGLEIIGEPELIAAQDILRINDLHIVRLTYRGHARGNVILDTEENDEYRWFALQELYELDDMCAYCKKILDKLYEGMDDEKTSHKNRTL